MPRSTIPPSFEPGSGWYQVGIMTPGSMNDRQGMREAAILTTVVVLYRRGQRMPAAQLLEQAHPTGLLLCMDRYTSPWWHGCLFRSDKMDAELLPRLMQAQLERERGGVRLYGGIEIDAQGRQEYRQAWLCTPTPKRAREILMAMLEQEGGDLHV